MGSFKMEDAKDLSKITTVRRVLFEDETISLCIRDQNNNQHSFPIKKTEEIKKVCASVIGEKNPENLRLLINGRRIQNDHTPQDLGLESGNVITVESTDRITITIQDQNSTQAKFNIKKTSKMAKLKSAFASKIGEPTPSNLRMVFDGRRINDDQTPNSIDLRDGDILEVFREMTGGKCQI